MSHTITRDDIAAALIAEIGLSRRDSVHLVDQVTNCIVETLATGEDVKIASFGIFTILNKQQRIARNPRTGQAVMIAPRRVVTFKSSEKMKNRITAKLMPPVK